MQRWLVQLQQYSVVWKQQKLKGWNSSVASALTITATRRVCYAVAVKSFRLSMTITRLPSQLYDTTVNWLLSQRKIEVYDAKTLTLRCHDPGVFFLQFQLFLFLYYIIRHSLVFCVTWQKSSHVPCCNNNYLPVYELDFDKNSVRSRSIREQCCDEVVLGTQSSRSVSEQCSCSSWVIVNVSCRFSRFLELRYRTFNSGRCWMFPACCAAAYWSVSDLSFHILTSRLFSGNWTNLVVKKLLCSFIQFIVMQLHPFFSNFVCLALYSLYCADVPLTNCSLTHRLTELWLIATVDRRDLSWHRWMRQ